MSERLSVLIVDDEASIRVVLRMMLEHLGCDVTETMDGPEALQRAHAAQFHLAIVDHNLPTVDGTSICMTLEACRPEMHIVLSSGAPDALLSASPGIALLPKPYGLGEISELVDTVRAERLGALPFRRRRAAAVDDAVGA